MPTIITNSNISTLTPSDIQSLVPSQIQALTTSQIQLLNSNIVYSDPYLITPANISYLSLTSDQVAASNTRTTYPLIKTPKLSTYLYDVSSNPNQYDQIWYISKEGLLSNLSPSQISKINSNQFQSIHPSQFAYFTKYQMNAFNPQCFTVMSQAQFSYCSENLGGLLATSTRGLDIIPNLSLDQITGGSLLCYVNRDCFRSVTIQQIFIYLLRINSIGYTENFSQQNSTPSAVQQLTGLQISALGCNADNTIYNGSSDQGINLIQAMPCYNLGYITSFSTRRSITIYDNQGNLITNPIATKFFDSVGRSLLCPGISSNSQLSYVTSLQFNLFTMYQLQIITTNPSSYNGVIYNDEQISSIPLDCIKNMPATRQQALYALPNYWYPSGYGQIFYYANSNESRPIIYTANFQDFLPSQIALLSPEQIAVMTRAQIQALSSSQIAGLTSIQLKALTPTQIQAIQIQLLSTSQLQALTPTQIQALSQEQLQALTPIQYQSIILNQIQILTSTQLQALTPIQIQALTTTQIQLLTPTQIQLLTPTQIQALTTSQIQALTTSQIQALTTSQIQALTTSQIQALTTSQIQALTPTQIQALTTSQIQALTTSQIQAIQIQAIQIQALTTSQLQALTSTQIQALTPTQIQAIQIQAIQIQTLTPTQIQALTTSQIQALTSSQIQALSSSQIQALSSSQIQALTSSQIQALQLQSLSQTQLQTLSQTQLQTLSQTQLQALNISYLSPIQIAYLTIANLSTSQIQALSQAQLQGLTSSQLNSLSSAQWSIINISQLSVSAIQGMSPTAFSAIPATIFGSIPTAVFGLGFPTTLLQAITTTSNSQNLGQCYYLTLNQAKQLSYTNVSILSSSSTQMGSLQQDVMTYIQGLLNNTQGSNLSISVIKFNTTVDNTPFFDISKLNPEQVLQIPDATINVTFPMSNALQAFQYQFDNNGYVRLYVDSSQFATNYSYGSWSSIGIDTTQYTVTEQEAIAPLYQSKPITYSGLSTGADLSLIGNTGGLQWIGPVVSNPVSNIQNVPISWDYIMFLAQKIFNNWPSFSLFDYLYRQEKALRQTINSYINQKIMSVLSPYDINASSYVRANNMLLDNTYQKYYTRLINDTVINVQNNVASLIYDYMFNQQPGRFVMNNPTNQGVLYPYPFISGDKLQFTLTIQSNSQQRTLGSNLPLILNRVYLVQMTIE